MGGPARVRITTMDPGSAQGIPLAIMGGSDARPSELPPEGRKAHPLRGPKGARIQIDGRSLISVLVERVTATGLFDPIIVVGPAAAYGPLALPIPVVDADGSFGDNVQVAVSAMRRAHPGRSVAFLACDVFAIVLHTFGEVTFDRYHPLYSTDPTQRVIFQPD